MIVRPSAMQRVASALAPEPTPRPVAAPIAKPELRGPMKLSDLTPADIRELRVLAAIELAYPVQHQAMGDKRASVTLAKWRAKYGPTRTPLNGSTGPGMDQDHGS